MKRFKFFPHDYYSEFEDDLLKNSFSDFSMTDQYVNGFYSNFKNVDISIGAYFVRQLVWKEYY